MQRALYLINKDKKNVDTTPTPNKTATLNPQNNRIFCN